MCRGAQLALQDSRWHQSVARSGWELCWPEHSSSEHGSEGACIPQGSFCTNAQCSLSYSHEADKPAFGFFGSNIPKSLNSLKIVKKLKSNCLLLVFENIEVPKIWCLCCPHCASWNPLFGKFLLLNFFGNFLDAKQKKNVRRRRMNEHGENLLSRNIWEGNN